MKPPTQEQLEGLYALGHEITLQFRCLIRLIDILSGGEVCIVVQPREFSEQRIIIYIEPDGGRRYV